MPHSSRIDHGLLLVTLALVIFGVIMITSIGVPKSIQLSAPDLAYPDCNNGAVDCYLLIKRHLIRLVIGLVAFLLILKINYQFWKKLALPFFVITFLLLIAVLIIGSDNNTFARSWIQLYDNSIQPSEFAKLALILYFAYWMSVREPDIKSFHNGFVPFVIISGIIVFPVILQPDLGSTIVFAGIALAMYFVAGARIRDIAFGVFSAVLIGIVLVTNVSYLKNRIADFLSKEASCQESYCWQSTQAKIAIGSGGLWGKGLTQGIQKSYWLPQASDDFIFAASAEELGFIKIIIIVFLYLYIAYRGYIIALHAPTRFGMLVATGITTWITLQAFINIGVNVSLLPVTGLTLPFVSYGGSSLVASLIGMAILLNISQYSTYHASYTYRRRNRRPYSTHYRPGRKYAS